MGNDTPLKACTKCEQDLPATTEFFSPKGQALQSNCKSCRAGYARKWSSEHPEKVKSWHKQWLATNAERRRVTARLWDAANREKVRENKRRWRADNPEKIREKNQKWITENSEKIAEYGRQGARKRRARKAQVPSEPYVTQDVLDAYGITCYLCLEPIDLSAPRRAGIPGWELGLHIEHVIAIVNGGPDTLANVRPSHGLCNIKKGLK